MKIEARLEHCSGALRPVLFFPDTRTRSGMIEAYSPLDGHTQAARAYMRQCKDPTTPEEFASVYKVLAAYFSEATRYAEKR